MDVEQFLRLINGLTGTSVKPLKDNERGALARALRDDGRRLDCSQLNELLLLVNKDRLEQPFFDHFFPKDLTVARLPQGIEQFQKTAMLCFGNFVHAYRLLSRAASAEELRLHLGETCREPGKVVDSFKKRSPKILEIDPISREKTFLIGYLSARQITDEKVYADVLLPACEAIKSEQGSWKELAERVGQLCKERDRPQVLGIVERYRKLNPNDDLSKFAELLKTEYLPQLEKRLDELNDAQQRATNNQDIYLTWDHMDVYFATSMRKRWEFEDLYDFVSNLMVTPELAELNLRYFDPTQSFTPSRIDKGLVEALMLKRAKCTVYSVQDTDTLGKDSELAATLAQGKPVIAYVPMVDIDKRASALSREDPPTIRERLSFLAYADTAFASSINAEDMSFIRGFKALEEFDQVWRSLPDANLTNRFRAENKPAIDRLCKILAASEKCLYDGRASTLKDYHPLGLQVHLETGVAQGVLVVRTVPECASLLRRVLTNDLEFIVEDSPRDRIWYLKERSSGSVYRVVTQDAKLTNCFWNYYRAR
jgi:hypothetical protein